MTSISLARGAAVAQPAPAPTIVLHLLPGALGTIWYVLAAPIAMRFGLPALLALYSAIVPIIAFELGYLLFRRSADQRLLSADQPPRRLALGQLAVLVLLSLAVALLGSWLLAPVEAYAASKLFAWLPGWYRFADLPQYAARYSRATLLAALAVGLALNGVAAPIVEELYFRGYLLPRLARYGRWAALINAALFSLYHFWAPWQLLSRVIVVLPWAWAAQRKQTIAVGVICHCLLNVVGTLALFASILR
jgi:membrane protease YdiL (CAAX protease family)